MEEELSLVEEALEGSLVKNYCTLRMVAKLGKCDHQTMAFCVSDAPPSLPFVHRIEDLLLRVVRTHFEEA